MAWFQAVSDAVALMLCAVFDLDPTGSDAASRFIPAYLEDATTPQAPRNKNVVYYALSEVTGVGFDYIQTETKSGLQGAKTTLTKTVPVSALLTFYGSNADDDAEKFWSRFQWDSGSGSPRAILRAKNIVPIGLPDRPVSMFEVEGTFHRRRCDVRLQLAYLEVTEYATGTVEQPPAVETRVQY